MQIRELGIAHAFEVTPVIHGDDRGVFLEWFKAAEFEAATGRALDLRQANISVSQKGTVRGIHFADVPTGQAKYVTAVHGSFLDYIVDIRAGSPTFGQWEVVELNDESRSCVFLGEGLGHVLVATSDSATVSYLTTDHYRPANEHTVNALDPAIGLPLPANALLSDRDAAAPSLAEALDTGLLPSFASCESVYAAARAALGSAS